MFSYMWSQAFEGVIVHFMSRSKAEEPVEYGKGSNGVKGFPVAPS